MPHARLKPPRLYSPAGGRSSRLLVRRLHPNAGMDTAIALLVFLVVWVALQVWVLPRLGVPT